MSHNPPRLITTKPGYNASPSVADIGKSFDSNWFDGGGIRWVLNGSRDSNVQINFPYTLTRPPVVTPIYDRPWTDDYWETQLFEYNSDLFPQFGWPNPPKNSSRLRTPVRMELRLPTTVTSSYLRTPTYNPIEVQTRYNQPDKYIVWSL